MYQVWTKIHGFNHKIFEFKLKVSFILGEVFISNTIHHRQISVQKIQSFLLRNCQKGRLQNRKSRSNAVQKGCYEWKDNLAKKKLKQVKCTKTKTFQNIDGHKKSIKSVPAISWRKWKWWAAVSSCRPHQSWTKSGLYQTYCWI